MGKASRDRARSSNLRELRRIMIKDRAFWTAWESQGPLRESLSPSRARKLCDAMYEYARSLGVFPPPDPLAGLKTKISRARIVNVRLHSDPSSPTSSE